MFDRINDGLWWDRPLRLVEGCTPVSAACDHCWAARETHRMARHPNAKLAARKSGLTDEKTGQFNGVVRVTGVRLCEPNHVHRPTAWAAWNDLFHADVETAFLDAAFSVMARAEQHLFLILTKRPERMKDYMDSCLRGAETIGGRFPWPNIWLGVTAEDQATADERIPLLLQTPAAKRFVSVEPMLGPVNIYQEGDPYPIQTPRGVILKSSLDWVICGGETGPGARPMHPAWVRLLRDQCQAAQVPFFFKQWGEWGQDNRTLRCSAPSPECRRWDGSKWVVTACDKEAEWMVRVGKKTAGRLLDGKEWLEVPGAAGRP